MRINPKIVSTLSVALVVSLAASGCVSIKSRSTVTLATRQLPDGSRVSVVREAYAHWFHNEAKLKMTHERENQPASHVQLASPSVPGDVNLEMNDDFTEATVINAKNGEVIMKMVLPSNAE